MHYFRHAIDATSRHLAAKHRNYISLHIAAEYGTTSHIKRPDRYYSSLYSLLNENGDYTHNPKLNLRERRGAETDICALKTVLKGLYFKPFVYRDKSFLSILKILKQSAASDSFLPTTQASSKNSDEPREFNLPTLPQKRITYVPEKLPSKYGVHSEEYLPIRTTTTYLFVVINYDSQHGHGAFDLYCGMLPYATDDNKCPAYDLPAQNTVRKRSWQHTDRTDRHLLLRRSSYTVHVLKFRLNALINRQLL
ncbi:hypothetical protein ANN_15998 [Periplaneta americana]|uniref:Caspase family p20 domain-containing protein n=1 Tax=Periplaneta americana TaxID=6978 RepID=A0ABQ8SJ46_PERAM|nr:hypothetical protein ANN_15998 [Periplaneta americana]